MAGNNGTMITPCFPTPRFLLQTQVDPTDSNATDASKGGGGGGGGGIGVIVAVVVVVVLLLLLVGWLVYRKTVSRPGKRFLLKERRVLLLDFPPIIYTAFSQH